MDKQAARAGISNKDWRGSTPVAEAARKAALETGPMRLAGMKVCDLAHVTGAMREAELAQDRKD